MSGRGPWRLYHHAALWCEREVYGAAVLLAIVRVGLDTVWRLLGPVTDALVPCLPERARENPAYLDVHARAAWSGG